jgi:hypothetical protein
MKRFDKDGNGEISDKEREEIREYFRNGGSHEGFGSGGGNTNSSGGQRGSNSNGGNRPNSNRPN